MLIASARCMDDQVSAWDVRLEEVLKGSNLELSPEVLPLPLPVGGMVCWQARPQTLDCLCLQVASLTSTLSVHGCNSQVTSAHNRQILKAKG